MFQRSVRGTALRSWRLSWRLWTSPMILWIWTQLMRLRVKNWPRNYWMSKVHTHTNRTIHNTLTKNLPMYFCFVLFCCLAVDLSLF